MRKLIATAALSLLLVGCTSTSGEESEENAPDAQEIVEPAFPATYSTVEELRDAFVKAGGDCPDWEQANQITAAAESGMCSDENVLSIYTSESSRDQTVATLKEISVDGVSLLVGENWVINDPQVKSLDPALGGTHVTS